MTWTVVAALGAGYLIGSIDFAVLVARAGGVDIYGVGSGNPGTANVARAMGWKAAGMVLAGDVLKGAAAAGLGLWADDATLGFGCGLAAAIGHCFPLWHRFKGGKGVATGGGALLVLAPLVAAALALIWVVMARLFHISSIASLTVAVLAVPALAVSGETGWSLVWVAAMVAIIVGRHHANIGRLWRREETLLSRPPRPDPES